MHLARGYSTCDGVPDRYSGINTSDKYQVVEYLPYSGLEDPRFATWLGVVGSINSVITSSWSSVGDGVRDAQRNEARLYGTGNLHELGTCALISALRVFQSTNVPKKSRALQVRADPEPKLSYQGHG